MGESGKFRRKTLNEEDLQKIKDRMVEIINNDIVINKIKVKKEKAMEV